MYYLLPLSINCLHYKIILLHQKYKLLPLQKTKALHQIPNLKTTKLIFFKPRVIPVQNIFNITNLFQRIFRSLVEQQIILMKYSSNQVVKITEYEFEFLISKAQLKTKFPCKFYTTLRHNNDLPELFSNESTAENGEVKFNHTHSFTSKLISKGDVTDPYEVVLSVGLRSKYRPLQKIIAGFVTLNLANYTKYSHPTKTFKIERCPDPQSLIEITIKSSKIRETMEGELAQQHPDNYKFYKCHNFKQFQPDQKRFLKKSQAMSKSVSKEELRNSNISEQFLRCQNSNLKQSEDFSKLFTPDRSQNCQLSFAQLRDSMIKKSLNYDEVKTSTQILPSSMSQLQKQNQVLQNKNQQLQSKLEQTNKSKWEQQAQIRSLQEELQALKSKLQGNQKSLLLEQTTHNNFTQRQLQSQNFVSLIGSERDQKSINDTQMIEKNIQLTKSLCELKEDLANPMREIQQILHGQVQNYQESSSWEALNILQRIIETLSLS